LQSVTFFLSESSSNLCVITEVVTRESEEREAMTCFTGPRSFLPPSAEMLSF